MNGDLYGRLLDGSAKIQIGDLDEPNIRANLMAELKRIDKLTHRDRLGYILEVRRNIDLGASDQIIHDYLLELEVVPEAET